MSLALEQILSVIEAHTGKPARKSGKGYRALCPYHGGKHHNLSITDGDDRVLLHCHSNGCDPLLIMESIGLSIQDIYHEQLTPGQAKQHKTIINDRELKKELEFELLILLCWISDSNKAMFPIGDHDADRVGLAIKRVSTATNHYIAEGVK